MARTEVTGSQIKDRSVDLTLDVTGILPIENGGTGSTTFALNNVLLGNGTGALQAVSPGTSGNVLTSNGTTWVSAAPAALGVVTTTGTQTLTNKTLTGPKIDFIKGTRGGNVTGLNDVSNAVNYLAVQNAPTTAGPILWATGPDANVNLNLNPKGTGKVKINYVDVVTTSDAQSLSNKTINTPTISSPRISDNLVKDSNGNNVLGFSASASAVNYINLWNRAAAGAAPVVEATGSDTNVSLNLRGKGTGTVQINGLEAATTTGTQTLTNKTLTNPKITGAITGTYSFGGTPTWPTFNQSTTGSAATLTTARTIGGVSFNGSANINLPGVNITGNQDTTGNAATATNATQVGGFSASTSATANTVAVRQANGYLFASYFSNNHAVTTRSTETIFYSSTDDHIRKNNATGFKTSLALNNVDNTSDVAKPVSTATQTALNLKENTANKAVANGYASLDTNGKVPGAQLPNSIMTYQGLHNASTNSPALTNAGGAAGQVYRISVAGTRNYGSGNIELAVGDYLIHNGTAWEKADTTDAVSTVNGYTGNVSLVKGDVGLGNVDNTSDATKNAATATLTNKTISGSSNTLSNISINSLSDSARLFNNTGANHGTNGTFDAQGATNTQDFGWRFCSTSTNSPGTAAAGQYYTTIVGLGNNYAYNTYSMQIAYPRNTATPYISIRYQENGVLGAWHKISAGYADTAGSATTATSATRLTTARTIGGVSFNGSANINLPGVNTTGNQNTTGSAATLTTARTIGGVSFNGSANINLPGVNVAGNQNTTGNAATATTLQTARTINGVSFNGSANITIADSTKEPKITAGTTAQYWRGDKSWQTLNATAVGLGSVNNTADASKNVLSATKLTTARTIGGVSFNGTANINLPGVNTAGNQNTTGNAATATNATQVGGYSASTSASANTVAVRQANGYLFATYFNNNHAVTTRSAETIFYSSTDDYIRKNNATGFKTSLGLNNVNNTSDATKNSAAVTLTNKTLAAPTVTDYTESVVAVGTVTTTHTFSLTGGTIQTATLTASTACTFTMPTAAAGKSFTVFLKQAATTGGGSATFTGVKWSADGAPTITTTAAAMDIIFFTSDGTNWYGSYSQGFMP